MSLIALALTPASMYAQVQDQFVVGQSIITVDTAAPTAPTGLSATGISTSAISLAWNPSNDNVGVTGYEVFRDGIFVATSTGENYVDSGLASSTAFAYTVRAFDAAFNFSAHSATTTGTTLSPAPPQVSEDEDGDGSPPQRNPPPSIVSLSVETDQTSAKVVYRTDQPTTATVSWGIREAGDLGRAEQVGFRRDHATKITNLAPGTRYHLEITVENERGKKFVLKGQTFTTKQAPDTTDPEVPLYLRAVAQQTLIDLSWRNPSAPDFAAVRLVRSTRFYPADPQDGEVLYDGSAEAFKDERASPGVTYYYALFARDYAGNYSAGAIASARIAPVGQPPLPTPEDPFEGVPDAPSVPASIDALTLFDFDFIQNGIVLPQVDGSVDIASAQSLTVRISYERLPEVLKTIAVTLRHADDPAASFTFILKVNRDKSTYEATVAPLARAGKYSVAITVLDYKNQKLKKLDGALLAEAVDAGAFIEESFHTYIWKHHWRRIVFVLIALILLFLLWKRRRREEGERRSART